MTRFALIIALMAGVMPQISSAQGTPDCDYPDGLKDVIPECTGDPVISLDPNSPTYDIWRQKRSDLSEGRDPGPINVQRYEGGFAWSGIPTFFHAPVALTPEDLAAGEVDVAIMGAEIGSDQRARTWGPAALRDPRSSDVWLTWGSFAVPHMGTLIQPFDHVSVVDYGDAAHEAFAIERTAYVVRDLVREIASVQHEDGRRTIPFIVGGSHALEYPNVAGLTDVYGVGNVAVVHIDAHTDTAEPLFGHFLTHGSPVYKLVEEGLVPGKNYIQVAVRGWYPGRAGFEWMRKHGMQYHTMFEIEDRGWEVVLDEIIAEAQSVADYVHVSFDIDALDPSFAPGTFTPEPGGLTMLQAMPMVRRLCHETNLVGFDMVEIKPESDPTVMTVQNANRLMRECLVGLALKRAGITEPNYVAPLVLDDGK